MQASYKPQALGAECQTCPFNVETPVPPQLTPKPFRDFTIVLEGPGGVEAVTGVPLTGRTGGWMSEVFSALGIDRKSLDIHNSMACKPIPMASPGQFSAAIKACAPRLEKELVSRLPDPNGHLILAMGGGAIQSLTGKRGVHDWRGYPLPALSPSLAGSFVFPTFHPSFVMREPWYWPVLKADFQRALAFRDGSLKLPFRWPPLFVEDNEDTLACLQRIYDLKEPIGCDVETGGKDPIKAPLLCVGIATRHEAVSLRFPFDERFDSLMRAILADKRIEKVLQNGNHDLLSLGANDVAISANDYDLLPASRVAFPQIDHDLGFILSFLFPFPRYKSAFHAGKDKGDEGWLKMAKDVSRFREMKIYNAKDAWGTVIARPALERMLANLPEGA